MKLLAALSLLALSTAQAQDIRVAVFGLFKPSTLEVRRDNALLELAKAPIEDQTWHRLKARDPPTRRGGSPARFWLRVPGKIERIYEGTLTIDAENAHLRAIVTMPLETAVASIVAAESVPGASLEALKAQAVVTRAYLLATPSRHGAFDACDTTHCQFLRSPPAPNSLAEHAAKDTAGIVLKFQGKVIQAFYSTQCGGRTRTPAEAGWQTSEYSYFAVDCKACRGKPVEGHRIGLCQRGATALAAQGERYDAILRHYFPGTAIEPAANR